MGKEKITIQVDLDTTEVIEKINEMKRALQDVLDLQNKIKQKKVTEDELIYLRYIANKEFEKQINNNKEHIFKVSKIEDNFSLDKMCDCLEKKISEALENVCQY